MHSHSCCCNGFCVDLVLLDERGAQPDVPTLLKIFVLIIQHDEVRALARRLDLHLQLVHALTEELTEGDGVVRAWQNALNLLQLVLGQLLLSASKTISARSLVQIQICFAIRKR